MTANKCGRPPKKARKRNITGLRNQKATSNTGNETCEVVLEGREDVVEPPEPFDTHEDYGSDWTPQAERVGLKPSILDEDDLEVWDHDWVESEEVCRSMAALAGSLGKLMRGDDEWLPPREQAAKAKKKPRPKTYAIGPVVANKSKRSQYRHRHRMQGQKLLSNMGFEHICIQQVEGTVPEVARVCRHSESPSEDEDEADGGAETEESGVEGESDSGSKTGSHGRRERGMQLDDENAMWIAGDAEPNEQVVDEIRGRDDLLKQIEVDLAKASTTRSLRDNEEPAPIVPRVRRRSELPSEDEDGADGDAEIEEPGMDEESDSNSETGSHERECGMRLDDEDAMWIVGGVEPNEQAVDEIRSWDDLLKQIEVDLAKASKAGATLTSINQLMILRSFAILRGKGLGRMDASQQIALQLTKSDGIHVARRLYEQLPIERRGGDRGRSLLNDERVQAACRMWLSSLESGEVTPKRFRRALNKTIFMTLCIVLRKPICLRTARRWLVKLGWRQTRMKKGIYMDGHEHSDVVAYQQDIFLPQMAHYEKSMVQFVGPELRRVEPNLGPGEKRIIAVFQDESCIHAGEYKSSVWLRVDIGEQKLMKKSKGRIIHVSDFIEEENGRLVVLDDNGKVVRDARCIIYPGSKGSAWWDHEQLLAQMDNAIDIFEEAHPGCQALFIFDQSSAHASLGPDALRAFDMNKSNGGKQRQQHDTVIPMNNPAVQYRGKPQKMTMDDGRPKGLEQVLAERGFDVKGMQAKCSPVCPWENEQCCMARLLSKQDDFRNQVSLLEKKITERGHLCMFLPKFHCELNPIEMYWGWAKYRYRKVYKDKFEAAKRHAQECLDACPVDVIRRFFNRSWWFMSAYRKGLTGKAAEWAVRKQKSHRAVSERAMMSIDAVLGPPAL
ncbi:hypothetical protein PUNSTDRAFT_115780 [Punctularia strigosozonata HHB-11173 SS5]|uniref:uncharacterized protein n=1 Tax=Punctularia strigosozonata (strain HHB-11173) TaxID=741275 RepID=UPI0004417D14|nr:uncharacterized protein PUNSTDRAFT_115780 [Punctularia strigosozonata HHB-11173 SS5]EIN05877.1 hypothetical protein PUNSTDRAFT_115780 [Punctularia strigosozonata HHB-11173 SS5]